MVFQSDVTTFLRVSCAYPFKVQKPPSGITMERISDILDSACEYVGEKTQVLSHVTQGGGLAAIRVGELRMARDAALK